LVPPFDDILDVSGDLQDQFRILVVGLIEVAEDVDYLLECDVDAVLVALDEQDPHVLYEEVDLILGVLPTCFLELELVLKVDLNDLHKICQVH